MTHSAWFSPSAPGSNSILALPGATGSFLDTFPFNAGTTANDVVDGLPVLTFDGRSFVARMAGAFAHGRQPARN